MRADLHLHSYHSGLAGHLRFLKARDCYSDPEAVYRVAKARGMDVVTITDHDSIDGCLEFLNRHPDADDFFVSEEIECWFPGTSLKAHIGAYGINERIHRDVQPLRRNVFEATAYLRSQGVFTSFNHLFFFFRDQLPVEEYVTAALSMCDALEVRNGTMLPEHNLLIEQLLRDWDSTAVWLGGSDSHTLSGIGTTFTEVAAFASFGEPSRSEVRRLGAPREVSKDDAPAIAFLNGLRAGRARPGGRHGSTLRVAREIYGVVSCYWLSLLGVGRQDLSWRRRAVGLGFSTISMPFEFIPLLTASRGKRGERQYVGYLRQYLGEGDFIGQGRQGGQGGSKSYATSAPRNGVQAVGPRVSK